MLSIQGGQMTAEMVSNDDSLDTSKSSSRQEFPAARDYARWDTDGHWAMRLKQASSYLFDDVSRCGNKASLEIVICKESLGPRKRSEVNMATNPQSPPPRGPQLAPRMHVPRKKQFPWPVVALIAAGLLLLAIVAKMPTTPKKVQPPSAAQIPPQPTPGQVQLSSVQLTPSPMGDALNLQAMLHNNGSTEITGVEVQANFKGANGQNVGTEVTKAQIVGKDNATAQDLTISPIKPNETAPVRLRFDHYPSAWNKQMPELVVTQVTGTKP